MRSRVMPGSSPTIDRRVPVSRLKSVDLPTFGRPQIATSGRVVSAAMSASSPMPAPAPTWFRFRSTAALGHGDLCRELRAESLRLPPLQLFRVDLERSRPTRRTGSVDASVLRRDGPLAFELRRASWCFGRLRPPTAFLVASFLRALGATAPVTGVTRGALPFFGRVLACRCFLPSRFLPSFFGAMVCRLVVLSIIGPNRC